MSRIPSFVPDRLRMGARELVARTKGRNLAWLTAFYGADKRVGDHSYVAPYDAHFNGRRKSVRKVIEIGIGGYDNPNKGGASLRVWRRYFPNAEVIGVDLHRKCFRGKRITVERCDQGNSEQMASLAERHGPFDIVIDDGSHIGRYTIATFRALFSALSADGIYVIEDLHTSYDEAFEGGPPRLPGTGIALVKHLLDALQFDESVGRIDVHQGIAFIHKGPSVSRAQDLNDNPGFYRGDFDTMAVE